jgi:glucosylceramidase
MRRGRGVITHIALVVSMAAGVLGAASVPAFAAPAGAGGGGAPGEVRAWLTTGDERNLLSDRSDLVGTPDPALPTIAVDPGRRYQTVAGFGASITGSSAHLLTRTPRRDAIMQELFGSDGGGLGLGYLRQPMGASDFVAGPHHTYDDMPAGETDYAMKHFSIDRDRAEILPLLRQARRLNPRLKIMASPWSPPAWMKTNESLIGGRLKDDDRVYRAYARYFREFVRAYAREGVPIDLVTLQNEPQNRTPSGYPGMDMRADEQIRLIKAVGPALAGAAADQPARTRILGFDHNWSLHPNDGGPPDDPADPEYAASLLADPEARSHLAGTAYHCYFGDPERQTVLHDAHPDKDVYLTECSPSRSQDPATTFADTLHWHTRQLTVWGMRHWSRSVIAWNLALDPAGGPHNGGCDTCFGVVSIDPVTGAFTRTANYYSLGHASRFVRPGAARIESTATAGSVATVAFANPGGSIVVIAVNDDWGTGTQRFGVRVGGHAFSYALPAGAVATFTLPAE